MNRKQRKMLYRIAVTVILMMVLQFLPVVGWLRFVLYLVPYLVIGYDILRKAGQGILNGQVFDENFLMAVATVGAMAIGAADSGDYGEAIAVMLFYQIGELFQSYAVGKSRKNISQLMDIRPDYANIELNGKYCKVDPTEVAVDTVIAVRPGEKIPIDGVVVEGHSSLNTVALTGESLPRTVAPGDQVISGCININGLLRVRTTKAFEESTVSKILDLVENASSRKSRSEQFISKFARIYTPVVCYSALALAVLPPVWHWLILHDPGGWDQWIYRALSFLVASCPCALVISIPLTFFAGIGGASKEGILVKGSNYLEALSKTDTIVFDKTGTLTKGVFEVVGVYHNTMKAERVIEYAALAEIASSHPVAQSLLHAYSTEPDPSRVGEIQEEIGMGVIATVDGVQVAVGNRKLMNRLDIACADSHIQGTVIHVAVDGSYAGCVVIADVIKPTAQNAISLLKKRGIKQTVMLTGDTKFIAQQVGEDLGIDKIVSELLPDQKVTIVEDLLQKQRSKARLAFVGDGINDAPVLSRADIGIAMGAMGSDAAIEAADIVLMDDDPLKIPHAIRISQKCLAIVYQNIVFAIAIKVLSLLFVAMGAANMWIAIFADVGVMILAVLNSIRAFRVKKI